MGALPATTAPGVPSTMPTQTAKTPAGFFSRFKQLTPRMSLMIFCLAAAAFNFGYDQGGFSGIQAMDAFQRQFGVCEGGKCKLESTIQSVMTATPYLGKLLGSWSVTPITERLGRRNMMLGIVVLSCAGAAIMISATTAAQFIVGRVTSYFMAGFTVTLLPTYLAETSPADLRGWVGSQIQFMLVFGVTVAGLVNLGCSKIDTNASWRISTGVMFVMPVLLFAGYFVILESPRWLIGKGRYEKAFQNLRLLRKKEIPDTAVHGEVELLGNLIESTEKGSWKEVFNQRNRRRTAIAGILCFGQQITGQAFTTQYGTIFYKSQGVQNPFLMTVIGEVLGLSATFFTSMVIDGNIGRRTILLIGGVSQAVLLFIVGAIGTMNDPPQSAVYGMVVCLQLFGVAYNLSWAPLSYLTVGEVSNYRIREKTSMFGLSVSIITAFLVTLTLPYLLNEEYANLGPKVGFVYGSFSVCMVTLAWLFVPELKGRTLEEVDQLFDNKTPTRDFKKAVVLSTRVETEEDAMRVHSKAAADAKHAEIVRTESA